MLDPKFVEENLEKVEEIVKDRHMDIDTSEFKRLNEIRSELRVKVEELRAEQNKLSKKGKKERPSQEEISQASQIKTELKNLEPQLKTVEERLNNFLWKLPNLIHPDTPRGGEDKKKPVEEVGKPKKFSFEPKDHEELATKLDLIDFEQAAKVAGSKFYYLKNEGALLEFALLKYALDFLVKEDFTPFVTPDLAREEIIDGVGFIPRGPQSDVYMVEEEDLGLIGTSEITLAGYHANQVLDEGELPKRYAGVSHCFRKEAGSYGQYSKGLYRVHQFSKVEMFMFTKPQNSQEAHQYLLELEKKIFKSLDIPFRVVDIASGDLGAAAYRKFDLEAWMPGRDGWGEITSTSNATDYQARRLNIKYQKENGDTEYVHTINGTAIATSRAIIAILENFQKKDGSVQVPEALVPYVGKKIIKR